MLCTFDPGRRAVLTTDDSNLAVAAILTQPDEKSRQHPVAYESRKLTAAEQNYPARVLELLAVVHALQVFNLKQYLRGAASWGVWVRLRSADGQSDDHVAEDEPASEQDVRPLARRDGGLPLRRDAPAGGAESGRSADAAGLRGRARAGGVYRGPGPGESARAVFSSGARCADLGGARRHSHWVGGEPPGGRGYVRRR